ncbi:hypothetical protein CCR85_01790 [Rhodothalassium salexigens]|nr:hypothetical protein [Rhodothalassium salexigens]
MVDAACASCGRTGRCRCPSVLTSVPPVGAQRRTGALSTRRSWRSAVSFTPASKPFWISALALVAIWTADTAPADAQAREQIRVVGSSTVSPFASAVAEEFGRTSRFRTPIVEQTGTGGGLKLFCGGVGPTYPDVTNASRPIKASEVALCESNGVTDIIEIRIGSDGIVLANDHRGATLNLSLREIYLALAAFVPVDGRMVANPYTRWSDIRADLPDTEIEVLGPPPTSGTRDAFNELAMGGGAAHVTTPVSLDLGVPAACRPGNTACQEARAAGTLQWVAPNAADDDFADVRAVRFDNLAAVEHRHPSVFEAIAHYIREDGRYVEAGESDNLIVQKLLSNPAAYGIFGYSFLEQNADELQAARVASEDATFVAPTFENIESGAYPISRSLFFYVKKQHVGSVPGIQQYMLEFLSDRQMGTPENFFLDGELPARGLIPITGAARQTMIERAKNLATLDRKS